MYRRRDVATKDMYVTNCNAINIEFIINYIKKKMFD